MYTRRIECIRRIEFTRRIECTRRICNLYCYVQDVATIILHKLPICQEDQEKECRFKFYKMRIDMMVFWGSVSYLV